LLFLNISVTLFGIGERMNVVEMITNLVSDAKRIFLVSKKPTMDEFKRMCIIVALGIVIIGVIAFVIYLFFAITGIGL